MFALDASTVAEVFFNFQNTGTRLIKISVPQNKGVGRYFSMRCKLMRRKTL